MSVRSRAHYIYIRINVIFRPYCREAHYYYCFSSLHLVRLTKLNQEGGQERSYRRRGLIIAGGSEMEGIKEEGHVRELLWGLVKRFRLDRTEPLLVSKVDLYTMRGRERAKMNKLRKREHFILR